MKYSRSSLSAGAEDGLIRAGSGRIRCLNADQLGSRIAGYQCSAGGHGDTGCIEKTEKNGELGARCSTGWRTQDLNESGLRGRNSIPVRKARGAPVRTLDL